jgi:Xaa-Pro aminopeptidase
MHRRLTKLREKLGEQKLDALLVTNLSNVRYLCGYSGSNGVLLLTKSRSYFYTDFRYQEQVRTEVRGARAVIRERDLIAQFPVEHLKGIRRLGFEQAYLTYGAFKTIRKQLKRTRLVPCPDLIYPLRAAKDPTEIETIARAAGITDKVLAQVLPMVRPGVTEKDLAAEIDYRLLKQGGVAFDTIVASGPRGALPHAEPTTRKLKRGDAIVFDLGAKFQGYCSDMTRTVFLGKADRKGREVYDIVLQAQLRALDGIRAGVEAMKVDALARDLIKEKGYGSQFGHSLGHGVGLEVHELPGLNSRNESKLATNAAVTVEPGIYLPGWGGVRIEDLVVVTRQGCRILSKTSKTLIEL